MKKILTLCVVLAAVCLLSMSTPSTSYSMGGSYDGGHDGYDNGGDTTPTNGYDNGGDTTPTSVPEPSTVLLVITGLVGLGLVRKRISTKD